MAEAAHALAAHALVLLAAALLLLLAAVAVTAAAAHVAARHQDRLWSLIDMVVPGELWRPRTYLLVHLVLGFVAVAAAFMFAAIASNVVSGGALASFDRAFADGLRAQVPPRWEAAFRSLTWLGNGETLAAVTAVIAIVLAWRRLGLLAASLCIALTGSWLLNYLLKLAFGRPRPEGANPVLIDSALSFPSGHATSTLVFALLVAYLIHRARGSSFGHWVAIALLLAWSVAVGFSRLYLGVHYASDVAGGFIVGTAWAAVCVSGTEVALRRRSAARSTEIPGRR